MRKFKVGDQVIVEQRTGHMEGSIEHVGETGKVSLVGPDYYRVDLHNGKSPAFFEGELNHAPETNDQVKQAFLDGLAYATNCEVTDPEEAWRTSSARAHIASQAPPENHSQPAAYTSKSNLDRLREDPGRNSVMWGEPLPHHEDIPLYLHPPAPQDHVPPVNPGDPYMRMVMFFDQDNTAGSFLSEDGEGGFVGAVSRMAREIDRLRQSSAPQEQHAFIPPPPSPGLIPMIEGFPTSPQTNTEGVDIPRLPVGTSVTKVLGYPFPGTVVSTFHTLSGQERFVVEATGEAYRGMLHIFNGDQLRATTEGQDNG